LALLPMLLLPLLWLVPAVIIGGEAFWREIFYKQTVGRAVGAWVHKSPAWFYLVRAPFTLMPWFFLAVAALLRRKFDERGRFAVSWMLAVLVPYTLLSSKLDVYMIAMLPAVALLIARFVESGDDGWGRRANMVMSALFAIIGAAGLIVQPRQIKGDDAALIARTDVRALFAILLIAAIVAMIVTLRGRLELSMIATGFVPIAAFAYAAVFLVPMANEMASTRPLVRALMKEHVAPEQIALYVCPHLWVRGMDPSLSRTRQVDADELRNANASLIVARRKDEAAVSDVLRDYHRVGELRMIGKWFDVYRR
jgi:4-amino-4-deoxy-L-arabinose transferase-like glycosyltransferase